MPVLTETWLRTHGIAADPDEFMTRVMRIVEEMPSRRRLPTDLTSAQTVMLRRGGLDPSPRNHGIEDPHTLSRLTFADLVATGYFVAEVAGLLHVTDVRIRQRLTAERTLYGIKHGHTWRIPRFQFSEGQLVPGFDKLARVLPLDVNPVAVYRWFTLPNSDLMVDGREQSPRAWLLEGGDSDKVVAIAAAL